MPQSSTKAPATQSLLPRWANNQDAWIRAIVLDVLGTRTQCSDEDVKRYVDILLAEKKLSSTVFAPVPKIEEATLGETTLEDLRLDTFTVGDGINAIKTGSRIDFSPSLTVVFGENGSGKSGFVRVLKRAAGVRTAEEILHNVRGTSRPTPTGTFVARLGDEVTTIEWKNESPVSPLNRISIFDATGARLHVEDDLNYLYTPGELLLFPIVQNGIERTRAALDSEIARTSPTANTFLPAFDRECSVYSVIETLGAATDLAELRAYGVVPEDAEAHREELRAAVEALQSQNVANDLRRVRDSTAVAQAAKSALDALSAFDIDAHSALIADCAKAEARWNEAGSKAFDGLAVPGVLSDEWRAFVQAGEEYLAAHLGEGYPHNDDACAYCRQPLAAKALDLLRKYREFSNDTIKLRLEDARKALARHVAPLAGLRIVDIKERCAAEFESERDVLHPILSLLTHCADTVSNVAAGTTVTWPEKASALAYGTKLLSDELARLAERAAALQASVEKRLEALKAKKSELIELDGKLSVKRLLPQLEKRVADAKWVAKATIVRNGVQGTLRSLTEAAKEASETVLNRGFEKRFETECERLRVPPVTLNFPGRQGQVTRRKMVAAYRPGQVLSEGEQKALALADFFAEVSSVPGSFPVVFDDPITSMDYRRIHEVCDRVVALSMDHQVIVFTHNIWFAAELLTKTEKGKASYFDIRREGDDAGVTSAAVQPRVDTPARISKGLKELVGHAERAEGEVREALVEKGYEKLRGLCEAIVEQDLFKGVVQRYAPNIMMTKLEKVNVSELPGSMSDIAGVFDKACRYIASHSQPIETQGIRPTLEELRQDHETVCKAWEAHRT